jgi:hypothetical protein
MRTKIRMALGVALVPGLVATVLIASQGPSFAYGPIRNKVIIRQLDMLTGKVKPNPHFPQVSGGVLTAAMQASGLLSPRAGAHLPQAPGPVSGVSLLGTQGCPQTLTTGTRKNVKANQDCSFRRQAEETIAVNPTDSHNIIVGQNDSRLGFNQCGFDWTFDGGRTWGDQVPPFHQVLLNNGHVGDFCSDPTLAFDSSGNAYAAGLEISIDFLADATVVAKSNAPNGGAFYHSPEAALGSLQEYADSPLGVINSVYDPTGCTFNDKELMTVDNSGAASNGNVYMVWTLFLACTGQGVGFDSPIYFSQSTDGGFTWSAGTEISGANATYCTAASGESNPNACDQDQGGDPVVGPDGTIYVGFGNGNTPTAGINQHMMVKCNPNSTDCSVGSNWSAPSKIGDDYGTQPVAFVTDPVTGCPGGRQCIPPNGYRIDDFVQGSISVDNNGNLFFVWGDFRNGSTTPNCNTGDYSTSTPPCNNDVFYSFRRSG